MSNKTAVNQLCSLPLYYISFHRNIDAENQYRKCGFTNINHFSAIDGRKMDVKKLRKEGIISVRAYDDVTTGRTEHSGMPTMGAIGCAFSHRGVWEICVKNNHPAIIVAEEDNFLPKCLNEKHAKEIASVIFSNEPGMYNAVYPRKRGNRIHFFGTHFYFLNLSACNLALDRFFPIDVQVDWYLAHLGTLGLLRIEGKNFSFQRDHKSSIQTECVTCHLPKKKWPYIIVIVIVIIVVILAIRLNSRLIDCRSSCSNSRILEI